MHGDVGKLRTAVQIAVHALKGLWPAVHHLPIDAAVDTGSLAAIGHGMPIDIMSASIMAPEGMLPPLNEPGTMLHFPPLPLPVPIGTQLPPLFDSAVGASTATPECAASDAHTPFGTFDVAGIMALLHQNAPAAQGNSPTALRPSRRQRRQ